MPATRRRPKGHQSNGRGTLRVDRSFAVVGRIARASGTNDARLFKRVNEMLDALFAIPRFDLLRSLRDGKRSFLEVYEFWRIGKLDALPEAAEMGNLGERMGAWADRAKASDAHRSERRRYVKLIRAHVGPHGTLRELPAAVREMKSAMADTPPSFNHLRNVALAFLRDELGRRSELYLDVQDVTTYPKKRSREARHLTVAQITDLAATMDARAPGTGAMVWTLATTGMRPKEYWGRGRRGGGQKPVQGAWNDFGSFLYVAGTKTENAPRRVMRVVEPAAPVRGKKWLEEMIAEASQGGFQLYDLRRTASKWWEKAGIDRSNRQVYFGHAAKDVTDLYERDVEQTDLPADTERFAAWLAAERAKLTQPEHSPA